MLRGAGNGEKKYGREGIKREGRTEREREIESFCCTLCTQSLFSISKKCSEDLNYFQSKGWALHKAIKEIVTASGLLCVLTFY